MVANLTQHKNRKRVIPTLNYAPPLRHSQARVLALDRARLSSIVCLVGQLSNVLVADLTLQPVARVGFEAGMGPGLLELLRMMNVELHVSIAEMNFVKFSFHFSLCPNFCIDAQHHPPVVLARVPQVSVRKECEAFGVVGSLDEILVHCVTLDVDSVIIDLKWRKNGRYLTSRQNFIVLFGAQYI